MSDKIKDIAIVGAGPAGLFGLFYASMRDMDAVLLDSLGVPGGQLAALYPEKYVYDMPGFPRITAGELAERMYEQAVMHRAQEVRLGARVEGLERYDDRDCFGLVTHTGQVVLARTVLVTTGAGAFRPNRLPLEHIAHLEGGCVHYFVKDKSAFEGKHVVIVGGGDSALDWVLNLHGYAAQISLVHRRDQFRAHEDTVRKVMALPDVGRYLHFEVKELDLGGNHQLEQVTIENNKTAERLMLRADHVIVNMGFVASMGPVKDWGLELQGNHIKVSSTMETSRPGVYAAGDVTMYEGKIKLIATAASEAAIGVSAAKQRIDPTERLQPAHSSSLFEEKKPAGAAAKE